MKTKREVSIRSNIDKINAIQEDFLANKTFSLEERLNVVKYFEEVKVHFCKVLNNNIETENVSND